MDEHAMSCARCGAAMERGFLFSAAGSPGLWVAGEPRRWEARVTKIWGGREALPVTTFRCRRCGSLESFALPRQHDAELLLRAVSSAEAEQANLLRAAPADIRTGPDGATAPPAPGNEHD